MKLNSEISLAIQSYYSTRRVSPCSDTKTLWVEIHVSPCEHLSLPGTWILHVFVQQVLQVLFLFIVELSLQSQQDVFVQQHPDQVEGTCWHQIGGEDVVRIKSSLKHFKFPNGSSRASLSTVWPLGSNDSQFEGCRFKTSCGCLISERRPLNGECLFTSTFPVCVCLNSEHTTCR